MPSQAAACDNIFDSSLTISADMRGKIEKMSATCKITSVAS